MQIIKSITARQIFRKIFPQINSNFGVANFGVMVAMFTK